MSEAPAARPAPPIPPAAMAITDIETSAAEPSRASIARVLLIDDNRDFSELFAEVLQALGCSVEVQSDAQSALLMAQEKTFDLIFCDISMPGGMSGLQFAEAIRRDPSLAETFLVSISGHTSFEDREQAVLAGFDHVLGKPVKLDDINEIFATALRHRHLSRK